jgi:hypothetical protein
LTAGSAEFAAVGFHCTILASLVAKVLPKAGGKGGAAGVRLGIRDEG